MVLVSREDARKFRSGILGRSPAVAPTSPLHRSSPFPASLTADPNLFTSSCRSAVFSLAHSISLA